MGRVATALALVLVLAGCSNAGEAAPPEGGLSTAPSPQTDGDERGPSGEGKVDPRDGGLDVALGEWALTLEAGAIRPGRVTFAVVNRGTIAHGFEIEIEGEDDSSGPGGGEDGLKAETDLLQPGETAELTLDLPAGRYKVECLVDGHDDLGMEGFLEVRRDAPMVEAPHGQSGSASAVTIQDFAFAPAELEVAPGSEVTWTNEDPTAHTVTAEDGSFDSDEIAPGTTFSIGVAGNGPVSYFCRIHPDMQGTISVG
ncbi:MAG: plastocyanin/azurin family copper-binding protein [Actinomycetota bacterium]